MPWPIFRFSTGASAIYLQRPGALSPLKNMKSAVVQDCNCVLPYITPEKDAFLTSILGHNDLHSYNIFVNENVPLR
jgi:hypothetical protein